MNETPEPREPALDPEVVADDQEQHAGKRDSPPRVLREIVAGFARSGPAYHPIFEKFQPEHVSQVLTQSHQAESEERQLRREGRWFRLVYVLIGVAVFVFLTWFLLPANAALYLEILKGLGIFGAGAAGGYGLRAHQEWRSEQSDDT